MQFMNPLGALGFLLIPVLVLLYLLKQRYRELEVPSVYLWTRTADQWEASHPWQKWRNSLLFFLQLLALILLTLALMRPVWRSAGLGENSVLVLDVSLSMQAAEKDRSRLDRAKDMGEELIDQLQPGATMSILLSGVKNEILTVNNRSPGELRQILRQIRPQYASGDLVDALALAKSLAPQEEGATPQSIYLFTDRDLPQTNPDIHVLNLAENAPNLALTSLSYARNRSDDTITVLGLVQRYGSFDTATTELWCDGTLVDVRDVLFKEDERQGNVIFEGVPPDAKQLTLTISQEDALMADNSLYTVVQDSQNYKILLETERNIFLEKAIFLREDVSVYKSSPGEALPLEPFDLIIGDGWQRDALPENQPLWLIHPQVGNEWFTPEPMELGPVNVVPSALGERFFRHVDLTGVSFGAFDTLQALDSQSLPLISVGDQPLALARDWQGVKQLAFGFDLHNSNLPMKKDFPILVQNILSWFLPDQEGLQSQITAHEAFYVSLRGEQDRYEVRLPDETLLQNQSQPAFTETGLPGFYSLTRSGAKEGEPIGGSPDDPVGREAALDGNDLVGEAFEGNDAVGNVLGDLAEKTVLFAVNPKSGEEESDLYTATAQSEGEDLLAKSFTRFNQLLPILALLALLVMLTEWGVYHRGR